MRAEQFTKVTGKILVKTYYSQHTNLNDLMVTKCHDNFVLSWDEVMCLHVEGLVDREDGGFRQGIFAR